MIERQCIVEVFLCLALVFVAACSDAPEVDEVQNNCAQCPDSCVSGACIDSGGDAADDLGRDADNPDANVEGEPDAAMEDVPDAMGETSEPEADVSQGDCADDSDCEDGFVCAGNPSNCVEGCRGPEGCPVGLRCDLETLLCETGCDEDVDCGDEDSLLGCDTETFECVMTECRSDVQCSLNQYCDTDSNPNDCAEGCRVDGCAAGEFCDLETRDCVFGCFEDAQCDEDFYCESELGECVEGCRDDGDCSARRVCSEVALEEGTRQRCTRAPCAQDADCSEDEYCGEDPDLGGEVCLIGCRAAPDNCPDGATCDEEQRRCRQGCVNNDDCGLGELCLQEGGQSSCQPGCDDDSRCADGQSCIVRAGSCSCATGADCSSQQVCDGGLCVGSCSSDADCGGGEICHPERLVCLSGCRRDSDCGQRDVCDLQLLACVAAPCGADAECLDEEFCNLNFQASSCELGCRSEPNNCEEGQVCDPLQRVCIPGCSLNEDCPEGLYCDEEDGCVEGCRGDDECLEGLSCLETTVEEEERLRCLLPLCFSDLDCDPNQFCGEDEDLRSVCQLGCRLDPSTCLGEEVCNPLTRQCVRPSCDGDDECGLGEVCREETLQCEAGCGLDEQCSIACDFETQRCACETEQDCFGSQVCDRGLCLDPCRSNFDCGEQEVCDGETRLCVDLCRGDDECGEGQVCNEQTGICRGADCATNDDCESAQFCDLENSRCETGCRTGFCGEGSFCDSERRECVEGCLADEGCLGGFYCEDRACVEGCREDEECIEGEFCLDLVTDEGPRQRCLPPECAEDSACDEGSFCGINEERERLECASGCRLSPDNCPSGSACDLLTRECLSTVCLEDGDCEGGEICQEGLINECLVGCRQSADCFGEGVCDTEANLCSCGVDADCGDAQRCSAEGECVALCGSNADCVSEDEVCNLRSGRCELRCFNDEECGGLELGFRCSVVTLTCERISCARDEDCSDALFCDFGAGGVCSEGCRSNQCPLGQVCNLGLRQCVGGCVGDEECPQGFFCEPESDTCRVGCRGDSDCSNEFESLVCDLETNQCVAAPCAQDSGCSEFQFCNAALDVPVCETGCRSGGCGEGLFCDLETRQCLEGCEDDGDCEVDFVCDLETRACARLSQCQEDGDCQQGEICTAFQGFGVCLVGCRDDDGCPGPGTCNTDVSLCGCASNDDCLDAQVCSAEVCIGACVDDEECGEGSSCQQGICQEGCTGDESCADGFSCVEGRCLGAECEDDFGCLEEFFCAEEGRCSAGCRLGGCDLGTFCDTDLRACVGGCLGDDNCPQGLLCNTNRRLCQEIGDCEVDTDCGDGLLCYESDFGTFCDAGCREDEGCFGESTCDPNSELCVCASEEQCHPGLVCDSGSCLTPCFGDEECGAEACDLESGLCVPRCAQDSDCPIGLGCRDGRCGALSCAQDSDCPSGFCDTQESVCILGCTSDNECLEQGLIQVCDLDFGVCIGGPCQSDEACGDLQFCDLLGEESQCSLGCRLGGCEDGFFCDTGQRTCSLGCEDDGDCGGEETCDLDTHECVISNDECSLDEDCGEGSICLIFEQGNVCVGGCREDADCALSCDLDFGVCSCQSNQDCRETEACIFGGCLEGCAGDEDCGPGSVCDLDTLECVDADGCQDDFFEPNEEAFLAPVIQVGTTDGLTMCYQAGDPLASQDCYNVILPEPENEPFTPVTLSVTASFSHADGNLDMQILQGGFLLMAESTTTTDDETLEVVAEFSGGYTICVVPAGGFFESQYSLLVERSP